MKSIIPDFQPITWNYSIYLIISILFLIFGCTAPVNLTFDSAKTIDQGQFEVQASYSDYNRIEPVSDWSSNYGVRMVYGLAENKNLKFRYERINMDLDVNDVIKLPDFIDDFILDNIRSNVNFFEIEYKFKFQHAPVAIGLPISFYSYSRDKLLNRGYFEICPRAYFTAFRASNWIEMNFVPKIHIIAMDKLLLYPGFNMGLGLSNNLDQWAIRPEIGWDGFFSYGIALSMNPGTLFKPVRKKE